MAPTTADPSSWISNFAMSSPPQPPPILQRALTQDADGKPQITSDVAVPRLFPGTMLVKTTAVALNPSDFKMGAAFPAPGAIVGMDFAGEVAAIADEAVTGFAVGDAVFAAVHGSNPAQPDNGAFAEYVRVRADMVFRPHASLGPQEAATLGTALSTCAIALWGEHALALHATPDTPAPADGPAPPVPVFVYGGSTATGTIAIQLLRLAGYEPIATCSPRNFELCRSRGASAAFDYASPDVVGDIKAHTRGRLKYVLDCIADIQSVDICYQAIQRPGGRYTSLELVPDELLQKRRAVKPAFVLAPEVYGEEIKLGGGYGRPANADNRTLATRLFKSFQRLVDEQKIVPHPIQVLEGGLDGVVAGLDLLRSGAVSGTKLVLTVGG
ncbi:putative zinc-binding dehydrogenase [Rosellinia necatrix]|uniref:Putative zinc-binding dehydrogenase n=1 Tax=Rosellinia necatrix TaxID=77044 RepID=A0A1S8AB24_ROSNE|nr:putative zinc-binding dehydrogenase [Rosellinia necatrix]